MRYIKTIALTGTLYLLAGCGGNSDPGALKINEPKGGKLIADVPANLIKQDLLAKGLIDKTLQFLDIEHIKLFTILQMKRIIRLVLVV